MNTIIQYLKIGTSIMLVSAVCAIILYILLRMTGFSQNCLEIFCFAVSILIFILIRAFQLSKEE